MRAIKHIHGGKPYHWVGNGFYVQTLFSYLACDSEFNYAHTDPFLLLDYAEPTTFAPNPLYDTEPHGIGMHPHKGIEIVTIAYAGEISHTDSSGGNGVILEGDVQWMTAGRGIMHEEYHSKAFGKRGGILSMVQLWVNLPRAHKLTTPNYQALLRNEIPTIDLYTQYVDDNNEQIIDSVDNKIGKATLIAGSWQNKTGVAQTFTPVNLWDIELRAAGTTTLEIPNNHNVMLLVQTGELLVNDMPVDAGNLVQFIAPADTDKNTDEQTDIIKLTAASNVDLDLNSTPIKLLLLSGKPINEPVAGYGSFVMTTQEELKQTFYDYRNGDFG